MRKVCTIYNSCAFALYSQTAFDNHEALKDFFVGFPEFAGNDFYVTGESYAGIYVPTLSARLMDDPNFNFLVRNISYVLS